MTQVNMQVRGDGSAVLSTVYGDRVVVDTFSCDSCEADTPFSFEMYEVLMPPPSTGVQCAVLWFCKACGRKTAGATRHTADCHHD